MPGVFHMRHTGLPENKFIKGQPEKGVDLAEDLTRICAMVGGENIAAVFVEPTAGSFGVLPPPKGYLDRLRAICDQHGILLVFDEVITGWGRMGAAFGAQKFNVTPDLLTMAKAVTNAAQPLGAVASTSLQQFSRASRGVNASMAARRALVLISPTGPRGRVDTTPDL